MSEELQEIKEEMAQLGARMDNVEGYFDNFNTTLTNHMEDYKKRQEDIGRKVSAMEGRLNWGFWVIFALLTTVLAGFVGGFVVLLQLII